MRGGVAPLAVAGAFAVSGVIHLVRPGTFVGIVPRWLPGRRTIVGVSGLAELICAAGLFSRRRWAPDASTALLLAIWPANLQMALDAGSGRNPGPADSRVLAWGRLPLQVALIWAVRRG